MNKKAIGIIGCGAIGSALLKYVKKSLPDYVKEVMLWDVDKQHMEKLSGSFDNIRIASNMEDLISGVDIVIEAASPQVSPEILRKALITRKDVMIMSIGGLLGNEDLLDEARNIGIKVLLPSGAIAGIDGLAASHIAGIKKVTLVTRKSPRSLAGAPYISRKGIDLAAIDKETVLFEGNAVEAMEGFPKNVNVSALLSLSGIGAVNTSVKIVTSPEYKNNVHEIEIDSNAGTIRVRVENVPSPDNPRTSYLAALAAMASLKGYFDSVRIGT